MTENWLLVAIYHNYCVYIATYVHTECLHPVSTQVIWPILGRLSMQAAGNYNVAEKHITVNIRILQCL